MSIRNIFLQHVESDKEDNTGGVHAIGEGPSDLSFNCHTPCGAWRHTMISAMDRHRGNVCALSCVFNYTPGWSMCMHCVPEQ